jgi:uncharacterized membrane protein YeiB
MNYHGIMNYPIEGIKSSALVDRVFDISTGVFTTRFAATFVVIAGISVAFLTRHFQDPSPDYGRGDDRLRLVRRGLVLLAAGYFLNEAWPGTIIFFYGAYFICSAALIGLRSRSLALVTSLIIGGGVGVAIWRRIRFQDGQSTNWMNPYELESVRDFLLRVFIGYTHPVLPWLAFFCLGLMIGRSWKAIVERPLRIVLSASLVVMFSYLIATIAEKAQWRENAAVYTLTSMQPNERGLLYVLSTAGIAVLAILGINQLASRYHQTDVVQHLQRAGQMTLTLYFMHVLFYYAVVKWSSLYTSTGLSAALLLASLYWLGAIAVASWWHRRLGQGPAERIYRWLGG